MAIPSKRLSKVIFAIKTCNELGPCDNCPYHDENDCYEKLSGDILFYLEDYQDLLERLNKKSNRVSLCDQPMLPGMDVLGDDKSFEFTLEMIADKLKGLSYEPPASV